MVDVNDDVQEGEVSNPFPEYNGLSASELARIMKDLDTQLEDMGTKKSAVQKRYDWIRNAQLPGQMETEGLENFRLDGVGRVGLTADMWVSIPAATKEAFYEWLRQNGREAIITNTVNASSLKAMAKNAIKNGEPLPPDLIKITPYTRATITKV